MQPLFFCSVNVNNVEMNFACGCWRFEGPDLLTLFSFFSVVICCCCCCGGGGGRRVFNQNTSEIRVLRDSDVFLCFRFFLQLHIINMILSGFQKNPSKIESDLTNGPYQVTCHRAIRYSGCFGVCSFVGPVWRFFLDSCNYSKFWEGIFNLYCLREP